jgi:glutamine synthetase
MLGFDRLSELVANDQIETVIVAFPDLYGRLVGKRYDAQMFIEDTAEHGSHGCDYLLTVDMEMEPVQGYRFANWELGYGDLHLAPELSTLRVASWLEKTALVLCDVKSVKTHEPITVAPRSILKKQIDAASGLGFESFAASELEYYIFENSYRDAFAQGYVDLQPAGWYLEDYHVLQGTREEPINGAVRRHLRTSGIPVEGSKGEWGKGQHELNLRFANALEMADRHILMKQCFKEVADEMGVSVTFMAKPEAAQAGSSWCLPRARV